MLITPHTLSIITTHHCTAACEDCCFSCSPQIKDSLPFDTMKAIINDSKEILSIKSIVFTGGECFTLGNKLDDLVRLSANIKANVRCVTNGYWAVNETAALTRMTGLKNAGLNELNISTGTFHQKFVSSKNVINAAEASSSLGIRTLINVELCDKSDFYPEVLLANDRLKPFLSSGLLTIKQSVWIENKTDSKYIYDNKLNRLDALKENFSKSKLGCLTILNVITINPFSDIVACCGLTMEKIPELKLGKYNSSIGLAAQIGSMPPDILKIWVHLDGPEVILRLLQDKVGHIESIPHQSVHPCKSCLHLYSLTEYKSQLMDLVSEHKEDILNRYLLKLKIETLKHLN